MMKIERNIMLGKFISVLNELASTQNVIGIWSVNENLIDFNSPPNMEVTQTFVMQNSDRLTYDLFIEQQYLLQPEEPESLQCVGTFTEEKLMVDYPNLFETEGILFVVSF